MQFFDTIHASNPRLTADGYLVADAPVARTGVQLYRGSELGRPDLLRVRVKRPAEEVFSADSLTSYAYRPMTNDHPTELVTADNWRELAIGQTGGEVTRDGETVRVPLVMMDAAAISAFNGGKRELSMGYTADVEFLDAPATDDEGLVYDAVQTNLRMNHLALVQKGRAGNAKIGDAQTPLNSLPNNEGGRTMAELRKVMVDGLSIETTEQGAQAIDKLRASVADGVDALATLQATHDAATAANAAELAKRDAEIDTLKGAAMSDADLDARVAARAELVTKATAVHDADYTGKTDAEIRAAVVAGKLGEDFVQDKAPAYIDARFDILVEQLATKTDPVRQALGDSSKTAVVVDAAAALDTYNKDLQDAYKQA